jgi:type I restriction enzyme R subunit
MSELLDALIHQRKQEAIDYKDYLSRIVALTERVSNQQTQTYPSSIDSAALRALFDNLQVRDPAVSYDAEPLVDVKASKSLAIDRAIRNVKKADWRGNRVKEREVLRAIKSELDDENLAEQIFAIVKSQQDY